MDKEGYDTYACPVSKAVQLISGRWKPIILYLIEHDIKRFSLMEKKMPGISKKILTEQLRTLEKEGLIHREVIVSKHPQVVVYDLTPKGASLRELIDTIFFWGTENLLDDAEKEIVKSYIIKSSPRILKK